MRVRVFSYSQRHSAATNRNAVARTRKIRAFERAFVLPRNVTKYSVRCLPTAPLLRIPNVNVCDAVDACTSGGSSSIITFRMNGKLCDSHIQHMQMNECISAEGYGLLTRMPPHAASILYTGLINLYG